MSGFGAGRTSKSARPTTCTASISTDIPNLKRILLWEGFDGHPMRKDWKEAYYEDELKPFDSRWPDGGGVHRPKKRTSSARTYATRLISTSRN
ncbi:MAG: hypothetical protein HND48_10850 [Chloroflexi bacterium]|nr:hypothetical protein [Chloroflexota bacterium]